MQRPLESKIAALRGRARRLLAMQGLCWVLFTLVMAFFVVSWADWFIPLAWEVRLVLLLGVLSLTAWVAWKQVLIPLVARFDDLAIALRIERRWPGLNDRLSSAIEFLQEESAEAGDEGRHGSRALRDATIHQTLEEIEGIDFREAIDRRPFRLAGVMALWAVGWLAVTTVGAWEFQKQAWHRFLLGNQEWPRQTYLRIAEAPSKIARGESFELAAAAEIGRELSVVPPRIWFQALTYVVPPLELVESALSGRMPTSAKVTYRFSDGESATEALRPDDQGVFHGRIEAVSRSFRFYVAAGDDATNWQQVEVVPPPALTDATIRLKAPAYTRPYLDPDEQDELIETVAPGLTQIRAVEGTEAQFLTSTNKPIAEAILYQNDEPTDIPVTIDGGGRLLATSFPLLGSAQYWFSLRDTEGFRNREAVRYEIRTIEDAPPRVLLEEPINDRFVRADADVPIRINVTDDFGVQLIRLVYNVAMADSEPTEDIVVPLWASEEDLDGGTAKRQEVEYVWDLTPLNLEPNAIVTFYAEARDFYSSPDGTQGPNLAKSRPIRLRVVSDEELSKQFEDQRREIREEVERILDMQKQAQPPVREARNVLDQADELNEQNQQNLQDAEMLQQQVTSRVAGRTDGLEQKIQQFLEDLRNSKLPSPEGFEQMQDMRAAVERIRNENLNPAEQGIARATKALGGEEPQPGAQAQPGEAAANDGDPAGEAESQDARASLAEAEQNQQAIADELQGMLDGMKEFETLRGVTQDAEKLLNRQEEAIKQTIDTANQPDLMGKSPEQLNPSQRADLENLANRQKDVARDLQNLEAKINELSERLDAEDPLAASALREAAEQLREQGTSAEMNQAGEQLAQNQMGEARESQEQARQDLQDLVDSLQNRRETDLARLLKELNATQERLQDLRDRQAQTLAGTQQAQQDQENQTEEQRQEELQQLAKEQEQLREELRQQLQKLEKLRAQQAAQTGGRASQSMGQAQDDLDADELEAAIQNQEDALTGLDNTIDEVDEQIQQLEEQLAMEQIQRMRDSLRAFGERQQKILDDTIEYDDKRQAAGGRFTRAESFDVRSLARTQSGLKAETNELVPRLDRVPVFKLVLERVVQSMDDAAEGLQQIETGEETQTAERRAADRLRQLIDSLQDDLDDAQAQQQGGDQGGQGQQQQQGGDGIPTEAQLRMLKTLQLEINERTEHYDELLRRGQDLSDQQKTELTRLEDDQRTIADLTRDIIQPRRPDGLED